MKIELDKALLWVVPYLYLVAIMYYWGYWGNFEIDAFNYYSVSDLIKGVISPINSSIVIVLIVAMPIFLVNFLDRLTELLPFNSIVKFIAFIFLCFIVGLLCAGARYKFILKPYYDEFGHVAATGSWRTLYWVIIPTVALSISLLVTRHFFGAQASMLIKMSMIFCFILPFYALASGKNNALIIKQNQQFDYVVADSLVVPNRAIYKYLGKAGEYYILLTPDNVKQVIVPTNRLNPLIVERYSVVDSMSLVYFKAHVEPLAIMVVKHTAQKQDSAHQKQQVKR